MLQIVKQPYEVSWSRNPILFRFRVNPWTDNESQVNTMISVTLFAESEHYRNDFTAIKQVALRPDANGFAEIDFKVLLDAQLSFFLPKPGTLDPQQCASQGARYYIRYSLVNDYEQSQAPLESDILHVLKGGLANEHWHPSDFFERKILYDQVFLRYSYDGEKIGLDEPLWLYFIYPMDSSGVPTHINYNIDCDGGPGIGSNAFTTLETKKWQIYCVNAGLSESGYLPLLPAGSIPRQLRVYIDNDGNQITQSLAFKIDHRHYYETRTLHYFNSLGGLDTQVMRGTLEINGNYDKQLITLLDANAYASGRVLKPAERQNDPRERAGLKGDTGYIEIERMERLRDLMNSDVAYENMGTKLKPVTIPAANMKLYTNRDRLYSLALDWQDAFTDSNFTPDEYMPAPSCPAVEFLDISQETPGKPRVTFHLPDGYDLVEIAFFDSANGGVPPPVGLYPYLYMRVQGNRGSVDLDLPLTWQFHINNSPFQYQIWAWARVICDPNSTPISAGQWSGPVNIMTQRFITPYGNNDFATTYKGGGVRALTFANGSNSVLTNDAMRNNGTSLFAFLTIGTGTTTAFTTTGSAGGTFAINFVTGEINYTPPTSTFSGVDICGVAVGESIPGGFSSPAAYTKIYVTVAADDISTPLYAGKPYVKLVRKTLSTMPEANGHGFNLVAQISAEYYRDPLGTIPYDITGLSLSLHLTIEQSPILITIPDQIFIVNSGTSTVLNNQNAPITPPNYPGSWYLHTPSDVDWTITLLQGSNYYVL